MYLPQDPNHTPLQSKQTTNTSLSFIYLSNMTNESRIVIAVLCVLSISALLAVLGIKYVRAATGAMVKSREDRDAEA